MMVLKQSRDLVSKKFSSNRFSSNTLSFKDWLCSAVGTLSCVGIFILSPAFFGATELDAAQLLKLNQLERIHANVGFNELNRIAVKEGRIADIFANTNLNFTFDEEAGQIFVQPIKKGAISFSIKTESGLYQDILLTSQSIPSQTIILEGDTPLASPEIVIFEQERSYVDLISKLIKAMAIGEEDHLWQVSEINEPLNRWRDLKITHLKHYQGHRFHGEILKIENSSKRTKHLTEKNFLESSDVVAIALSKKALLPGEQGYLFKVVRNDKY